MTRLSLNDNPTVVRMNDEPTNIRMFDLPIKIMVTLNGGLLGSGSNLFAHDDIQFANDIWNFAAE